jgi:hypothetical protein
MAGILFTVVVVLIAIGVFAPAILDMIGRTAGPACMIMSLLSMILSLIAIICKS